MENLHTFGEKLVWSIYWWTPKAWPNTRHAWVLSISARSLGPSNECTCLYSQIELKKARVSHVLCIDIL
jgi:hypothetical protein